MDRQESGVYCAFTAFLRLAAIRSGDAGLVETIAVAAVREATGRGTICTSYSAWQGRGKPRLSAKSATGVTWRTPLTTFSWTKPKYLAMARTMAASRRVRLARLVHGAAGLLFVSCEAAASVNISPTFANTSIKLSEPPAAPLRRSA